MLSSAAPTLRLPDVASGSFESEPPKLLGLHRVGEELGRGGMGVVHAGRHLLSGRRVALKILPRWATVDADMRARFARENAALRALRHPSTVRALTDLEVSRGWHWYAMERVDGLSLHELLQMDGRLPVRRAAYLIEQIASALAEAHERGLVHRDLKPANVMIARPTGRPGSAHERAKLLDFGLVRDMHEPPQLRISRRDALIGTPGFLAPEAYVSSGAIDARSDVFALGLLGHTMLVGARRYGIRPPEDASHSLSGAEAHEARRLLSAIRACLDPLPERRPRSAGEVLERLDRALAASWSAADAAVAWF